MQKRNLPPLILGLVLAKSSLAEAATTVCVEIEEKSWERVADAGEENTGFVPATDPSEPPQEPLEPMGAMLARKQGIDPARYLKRMVSYEVTHDVGFEAVETDCAERLTLELYPFSEGWTVFARYSGTTREEKVDLVRLDEFVALAQRVTRALLWDQSVRHTLTRENVLRDDSEHRHRKVQGRSHGQLAFGTAVRAGPLPTATSDTGPVEEKTRILTPLNLHLGYRGKFQGWALDAFTRVNVGTTEVSARSNEAGGHADYVGAVAMGLHFLRYFDPEGVTSFYWGGGGQFELALFDIIRQKGDRGEEDRTSLFGGGLNLDLVVGYEFMRASSLQFFIQAEAHAPLYRFETENEAGEVVTYLPGGVIQIGMMF